MKIALIGATGFIGTSILAELLSRGHQVTALARSPEKISARNGLNVVQANALEAQQVSAAVAGHDAVISAYNPGWAEPELYDLFLRGSQAILAGVKSAGVKRLLIVGGAGSLYVAPGLQLVDTPQFPAEYKQGALAARDLLNRMQLETALDWSFISPPIALAPGPRSGNYVLGSNDLLQGRDGQPAGISTADLAVAIVDEIETPRHIHQRFTVAH
jgi:putative NADH-flavin reductase